MKRIERLYRERIEIDRKHVRSLMQKMDIEALYRKPGTTKRSISATWCHPLVLLLNLII
jgi:hypothetical protein